MTAFNPTVRRVKCCAELYHKVLVIVERKSKPTNNCEHLSFTFSTKQDGKSKGYKLLTF